MLDSETKRRIDTARDILVGKVPDPKSQVEQITIALIYKFMDDMDKEAVDFGGEATFFTGEYEKYSWTKIFDPKIGGHEMLNLYSEAIIKLNINPGIPQLFRDIFKNAYLPYRDPETLKMFLKTINDFRYDHSEMLGDAFEYLLSVLGSQGDAGQFRTPRHIIDFMVQILEPKKGETICDPACGTAGFLISSYKYIVEQNTKKTKGDLLTPDDRKKMMQNFTGYDISPDMVRLSLVNMYLHGFTTPGIHEYDSLTSEEHWNDYFDIVLANPPFMTPKGGIKPHKRFTVQAKKSEVLFTDYITEHINPSTGRAAIIVPNGIVSTTQSSYIQLRKLMVENSLVAVISLPAGVFQPYSGVKTSILILDKRLSKKSNQILFLKVEADGFDLGAQRRESDKNDLPLAIEVFQAYKQALNNGENFDVDCYSNLSLLVDKEIVLANKDIVLSAERYFEKEVSQTIFDLAKLIDVSEVIRGITFGKNDQVDLENNDTIKVATTKACQENGIVEKDLYNIPKRFVKEDKKYLQVGDILMSTANSLNLLGRTTYVEEINKKVSFGAFMSLIRSDNKKILPFYLLHCLRTDRAKLFFKLNANTTTNISNLSFEKLNSFEIPLPPLEIQQQIVAEIEAYQKIIDGAKQVVNNYKPTISIKPEWEMVELGDICEKITDGSHFSPDTVSEGFPYVTVRDINDSIVDLIDCKKINKEAYSVLVKSGCKPQKNDVLFSKDGTVGKVALIDFEADFVVLSSLAIITPNTKLIMPSFLSFILQSDFAFQQAINLKGGVAIKRVVLKDLKTIKIPNISTKEQTLIVQRIEEEQALVNANKRLITIFEKKIKDKINEVWGVKEEKEYETGEEEILLAAEPEE